MYKAPGQDNTEIFTCVREKKIFKLHELKILIASEKFWLSEKILIVSEKFWLRVKKF